MTRSGTRRRRATAEQQALAEQWLLRTGRAATGPSIAELAPHVKVTGKPDALELQAFARLVRLGQVPTAAAVRGEMVAVLQSQERRRRVKQTRQQVLADVGATGLDAARYVQGYRDQHAVGPTWTDLRRHTGWPREVVDEALRLLRREGWLDFDDQPGSLRPGPSFDDALVSGAS